MNNESGFGSNGIPYEYAVAEAKTKKLLAKKLLFLTAYLLWSVAILIAGVIFKLILPILCFIPLSVWILVFLTWRYTQKEYEYSFFSGELTVSKILGGRSRKMLCKVQLRDLSAVFPYEDVNLSRAEAFKAEKSIFAASGLTAERLYLALWTDTESGKRMMLCMELDEKAVKIIKYYNMSAIAK